MKTAEACFLGHPDKVCDQIADAIVDAYLEQDPKSRVAIEAMGGHGLIYLTGEITSKAIVDINEIAKRVYRNIYKKDIVTFTNTVRQSSDIAQGVDTGGAGDQGVMVGYATNETPELMPFEAILTKKIAMRVAELGLGPDGKCQVTLNNAGKIDSLVVSIQGEKDKMKIYNDVVLPVLKSFSVDAPSRRKFYFNPTGRFEIGGFDSDSGATGRKIVVDAYGPEVPVGGGSFSGKDPTKVDRSGAYMARRIAVDYLRRYSAKKVWVKFAYVIGLAEPVMSVAKCLDDNGTIHEYKIKDYDLRPEAVIERLDLRKPIYFETAQFGSFGREFAWER